MDLRTKIFLTALNTLPIILFTFLLATSTHSYCVQYFHSTYTFVFPCPYTHKNSTKRSFKSRQKQKYFLYCQVSLRPWAYHYELYKLYKCATCFESLHLDILILELLLYSQQYKIFIKNVEKFKTVIIN